MRYRTSELSGRLLDQAVSKAMGYANGFPQSALGVQIVGFKIIRPTFSPTENWQHGGPLFERLISEGLRIAPAEGWQEGLGKFKASLTEGWTAFYGNTVREAAFRAFVSRELGDEVELSEESV